ncbi:MAG: FAD-dependent monooxygenase [Candidatus Nanopelagicales bacterium]|nr:FAD-dependent monooxygenase [Candidatus Nanopelagicales bacterium]MCF8536984.1 FAD-dependent monooxygenase [Candidatus Nanopelagicales bacterium]MCF8543405.1 FAD-dependent monooxygenase [Candidatus Nanopelagicales bacterium]MCF8556841.1 FAD-dependent monooxygenase [Candidatus Nanopelagicales bacterium]
MRVIIVGGGIAGLTAAALLTRTGSHEVVVLERAEAYGDAGYGLGLYPLGAAVFHALGRYGELERRSRVLDTYTVHGPDGAVLQTVDLGSLLERFGPMLGVSRTDVIDILAGCLPEGTIRFGTEGTAAALSGDEVVVTTGSGEQLTGDLVVAADGMHSALRTSLFGEVALRSTGFDAWMWWAPEGSTAAGTASEHWGASAFVGLYPMPRGVNVAVGVPTALSPDPHASPEEILQTLRAVVSEHNPGAADLPHLWEITGGRPFLWPLADVRAPQITALGGRAALVGDSGLGFLPTAGVGASNALRSAAAFAYDLSLADAHGVPVAVQRWSHRVHRLVEGNQDDSRQLAKVMLIKHGSASKVVNAIMKHMPVTAMTKSIVKSMEVPF